MFVFRICFSGQKGKKTSGRARKERIKYRENGGMLPEEMMKPKNECQSKKGGQGEADHQESMERVKLCRSLAASEGSRNKRINEGMRGETERGKRCMGKKRREKRPAGKEMLNECRLHGGVMNDTSLGSHSSICPSLPPFLPSSLFSSLLLCAIVPSFVFLEKPETLHRH